LCERRIGEQADALALGELGESDLEGAVDEVVGVLNRNDARAMAEFGGAQETGQAPRGFVGKADVANFPYFDQPLQGLERLFDRNFIAPRGAAVDRAARAPKR